jgi:hypothetical protein
VALVDRDLSMHMDVCHENVYGQGGWLQIVLYYHGCSCTAPSTLGE